MDVTLSPSPKFISAASGLGANATSIANYLTAAWNNADPMFASLFGRLSQITDAATFKQTLDAYSARATQSQKVALDNGFGKTLGAAMSCPVFVSSGATMLGEDRCSWFKASGERTDASDGGGNYRVDSTTYRIGGQAQFAPDWFVGGALATGTTWAHNGASSGSGQTYDGTIAVKHTMGPWLFAGSLAVQGGSFSEARVVALPAVGTIAGTNAVLLSNPSMLLAGGRLRAAYEVAMENWYIRPYGDLDLIYSDAPGFAESGQSGAALDERGSSKTNVVFSPMVEIGGRDDFSNGLILRPYVALGASFRTSPQRTVDSSFVGAMAADGVFQTVVKSPSVLGDCNLGLQLYRQEGFEIKAEYGLEFGDAYTSQTASLRAAYHF
jgi:uncharacterized protein with beta-barrel porin domain